MQLHTLERRLGADDVYGSPPEDKGCRSLACGRRCPSDHSPCCSAVPGERWMKRHWTPKRHPQTESSFIEAVSPPAAPADADEIAEITLPRILQVQLIRLFAKTAKFARFFPRHSGSRAGEETRRPQTRTRGQEPRGRIRQKHMLPRAVASSVPQELQSRTWNPCNPRRCGMSTTSA